MMVIGMKIKNKDMAKLMSIYKQKQIIYGIMIKLWIKNKYIM